jgi:nicotinic acid mononucleotide adenylyltransferase
MTVSNAAATLQQTQNTQRTDAAKARQARLELAQARDKELSSAARSDRAIQSRQAVEVVQERRSQYHSDSKIGATLDVKV